MKDTTRDRIDESIGSGIDAIPEAAREAAQGIALDAERRAELRDEADVLTGRRGRLPRALESLEHDVEDAMAELAPGRSGPSPGETLDVRRRL